MVPKETMSTSPTASNSPLIETTRSHDAWEANNALRGSRIVRWLRYK